MTPNKLPPLPEPRFKGVLRGGLLVEDGFTADQMHAYAAEALRQSQSLPAGAVAGLVKELRESLQGVVHVADRDTEEFIRARAAIEKSAPVTMENYGDSEAQFIADSDRLNCPSCGGSGHVDDLQADAREKGEAPKLIGWRTGDYLYETSARDTALNWACNMEVLPIFEGDTNTRLATHPAQASEADNG